MSLVSDLALANAAPELQVAKLLWKPVVCVLLLVSLYVYAHHAGAVSQKAADGKTLNALLIDRQTGIAQLNADVTVFHKLAVAAKDNKIAYDKGIAAAIASNTRIAARATGNDVDYAAWVKRYQKRVKDNPKLALQLTSTLCAVPDLDY